MQIFSSVLSWTPGLRSNLDAPEQRKPVYSFSGPRIYIKERHFRIWRHNRRSHVPRLITMLFTPITILIRPKFFLSINVFLRVQCSTNIVQKKRRTTVCTYSAKSTRRRRLIHTELCILCLCFLHVGPKTSFDFVTILNFYPVISLSGPKGKEGQKFARIVWEKQNWCKQYTSSSYIYYSALQILLPLLQPVCMQNVVFRYEARSEKHCGR